MTLKIFILLIVIVIFKVGCIGQPNSQTEFVYPLTTGDQWIYNRTLTFNNFKPDTFQIQFPNPNQSNIIVINEGNEVIGDSLNTFRIKATETNQYGNSFGVHYYQDKADGLYFYAYYASGGGGLILPKIAQKYEISFKGYRFTNIENLVNSLSEFPVFYDIISDSIILQTPPIVVLQYPLQIGTHWNYRKSNNPWKIDKEIVDSEEVVVPAGRFFCYKIKWLYDMDHDNNWDDDIFIYDYIASIGLIRRHIIIKNIYFTDSAGNILGSADFDDDFILSRTPLVNIKSEINPVW